MADFSVVISVHNKEPHVERAVRSVFAQSYPPNEVVVVDDASTDRSIEIVQDTAGDRVKILRQPRPGVAGYRARNRGIREAKSNWIAFLDADDEWSADHLESLNAAIESSRASVGLAFAGHERYYGPRGNGSPERVEYLPVSDITHFDLRRFVELWLDLGDCPINASGIAVKRSVLLDVGGFPEGRCKRGGDKDLWLRACAASDAIAVPQVTSVYYCDAVNMVSKQTSMNRMPCVCHSIDELLADAEPHHRKLLQKLHNHEVLDYAFLTWRQEAIDRSKFDKFFIRRNPVGFVLLQAMMAVPGTRLTTMRGWLRWLRGRLRRAP